jgi:hypothetical protein
LALDWKVPALWKNDTAFIIAGGPSVADQDLSLLKGRRVIVVNSSYTVYPNADYLIFADQRWYEDHKDSIAKVFKGQVVSLARKVSGQAILNLKRHKPQPALTDDPSRVAIHFTTLQSAINLAVHLGVKKIVLLGADMQRGPDGRTHHHAPHRWKNKAGNSTWDAQMAHLRHLERPLREIGVEVINTSPVSRINWWPKQSLAEAVAGQPYGRVRVGVPDSREFDMLKRRNFRPYSKGHQMMYLTPIRTALKGQFHIFEAGFGIGFGLDNFVSAGVIASYTGVEPNVDSFNYTKDRHKGNPALNLINEPFSFELAGRLAEVAPAFAPDGRKVFDVAFCVEVIEHVPDELHLDFLRGLRLLAPRLFFSTPDIQKYPKEGVRTTDEWTRLLTDAGFGKVSVDKTHWTHLYACE